MNPFVKTTPARLRLAADLALWMVLPTMAAAAFALWATRPSLDGPFPLWLTALAFTPVAAVVVSLTCWAVACDLTRRAEANAAADVVIYMVGETWLVDEIAETLTLVEGSHAG